MKVFNIGNSEVGRIKKGLELLEESYKAKMDNEKLPIMRDGLEYELAHVRTIQALMRDQSLQELCERCMSYFWNMYTEMGCLSDELEELADDMGLNERELVALFREAGFEEV